LINLHIGNIKNLFVASGIFAAAVGLTQEPAASAAPISFSMSDSAINKAADGSPIVFTEREPDRTNEQIKDLIRNYQKKLVKAINDNAFAEVEPYLYPGSPLYESQKQLVANLSSRNIKERIVSSDIYGYTEGESIGQYKVEVSETIEIEYSDKDIRTKEYHWIYTVENKDGALLLSGIEQWTTFQQDLDRWMGSVKTEGYYADDLLSHYPKLLETAINTLDITEIKLFSKSESVVEKQKELISELRKQGSDYTLSAEAIYEDWRTMTYTVELTYQYTDKEQNKQSGSRKLNIQLDEIWNKFHGYGVIRYLDEQEIPEPGLAVIHEFSKIHPDMPESLFKVYGQVVTQDLYSADTIEVYEAGQPEKLLQQLSLATSTRDGTTLGLVLEDMNFDGYLDIRIQADSPAGPNIPYYYWLWDQKKGKYMANTELEFITSPEFDHDSQTIQSMVRDYSGLFIENTYRYVEGVPTLIKRVEWELNPANDLWHVTVKELRGQQLVITKQYEEAMVVD